MYSVLKVENGCYINVFTVNNLELAEEFIQVYKQRDPDTELLIVKDYVIY